jgi:hypothetical protein
MVHHATALSGVADAAVGDVAADRRRVTAVECGLLPSDGVVCGTRREPALGTTRTNALGSSAEEVAAPGWAARRGEQVGVLDGSVRARPRP